MPALGSRLPCRVCPDEPEVGQRFCRAHRREAQLAAEVLGLSLDEYVLWAKGSEAGRCHCLACYTPIPPESSPWCADCRIEFETLKAVHQLRPREFVMLCQR